MSSFTLNINLDTAVAVEPHRTADLYNSPGRWFTRVRVFARTGEGALLEPSEARALAQQLIAVAEAVERKRGKEGA